MINNYLSIAFDFYSALAPSLVLRDKQVAHGLQGLDRQRLLVGQVKQAHKRNGHRQALAGMMPDFAGQSCEYKP